jgi:hypothetical protein
MRIHVGFDLKRWSESVRGEISQKSKVKNQGIMADSALFPCAATLGMRVALETFTKAPAVTVTASRRTIKPARTGGNSPSA